MRKALGVKATDIAKKMDLCQTMVFQLDRLEEMAVALDHLGTKLSSKTWRLPDR